MLKRIKAFSLVELMIVLLLLSIIVAIAIPALESYIIRTKIGSFLSSVGPVKSGLTEFRGLNGDFRRLSEDQDNIWLKLGIPNPKDNSKYIDDVLIRPQGRNDIVLVFCSYDPELNFDETGRADLVLQGEYKNSSLQWDCLYSADVEDDNEKDIIKLGSYFPSSCRKLYQGDLTNGCKTNF